VDERQILERISVLVAEEHELERRAGSTGRPVDHARLGEIEVMLDQCWDLLRQRHARLRAGLDPDEAAFRDPVVVEHYEQ
jgi:hypothetical protein